MTTRRQYLNNPKRSKREKPKAVPPAPIVPPARVATHGEYAPAVLAAGGRAAYDAFTRICNIDKHALIPEYDKLKDFLKKRWEILARDVFDAKARVEDKS